MDSTSLLIRLLSQGNLILWIIAACSVIAIAIFIERLIALRRSRVDVARLLAALRKAILGGQIEEGMRICSSTGGPVASILHAGLAKYPAPREKIQQAMELTGIVEIARLEKNAKALSIIATLTPLIGLLGTVVGFIQAFGAMRQGGVMDITTAQIGGAMEFALETTAAGLVVAIPAVIAYNYIVSRIEAFLLEIQTSSAEIADLLVDKP